MTNELKFQTPRFCSSIKKRSDRRFSPYVKETVTPLDQVKTKVFLTEKKGVSPDVTTRVNGVLDETKRTSAIVIMIHGRGGSLQYRMSHTESLKSNLSLRVTP